MMKNQLQVVPFPGPAVVSSVSERSLGQITEPALASPRIRLETSMSLSFPPSSCLEGKFSHPEIVQLVSELEEERNANIAAAASAAASKPSS